MQRREDDFAAVAGKQRAELPDGFRMLHPAHERLDRDKLVVQLVVNVRAVHLQNVNQGRGSSLSIRMDKQKHEYFGAWVDGFL